MTMKIVAVLLLSLALTACEAGSSETNNNSNTAVKPSPNAPAVTPAASAPAEASPAATLKAGDKVNVSDKGRSIDATVVSGDEKAGKVTVKIPGEKDRAVPIADVKKQ